LVLVCTLLALLVRPTHAAVSAADKARLSALFPADGQVNGWRKRKPIAFYDKQTLFNYLDGQADAFFVYDFRACAAADYVPSPSSKEAVTVDVYDMGQDTDAFGMYASERYTSKEIALGTQGYVEPDHANFWKGRYYVKVTAVSSKPEARRQVLMLARAVAARIKAPAAKPAILKRLPPGYIRGTEKYSRMNLMGQKFMGPGVQADYAVGKGKATVFVAPYANVAAAKKALAAFAAYERSSGRVTPTKGIGEEGFRANDRYLKALLVARKGSTVAGSAGAPGPQVEALVRRALGR